MIGWFGDKIEDLSLELFADADFAGCAQSLRSTSGSHLQVQGKYTRFPLAGGSKRQGRVSHSTPEAEIVAADTALRTLCIPAISRWKVLAKVLPNSCFMTITKVWLVLSDQDAIPPCDIWSAPWYFHCLHAWTFPKRSFCIDLWNYRQNGFRHPY